MFEGTRALTRWYHTLTNAFVHFSQICDFTVPALNSCTKSMDVCTTRHRQASGRLVQGLNVLAEDR